MSKGLDGMAQLEYPPHFIPDVPQGTLNTQEVKLAKAIIEDAIQCYFRYSRKSSTKEVHLFNEVNQWIYTDDYVHVFSFVNICGYLNVEPTYLRKKIRLALEVGVRGPKQSIMDRDYI